jgi:hypothetical protein
MTANSNFKSARGGGKNKTPRSNKEEDELINKIYQVLADVQDYTSNLTPELIANACLSQPEINIKNTNQF